MRPRRTPIAIEASNPHALWRVWQRCNWRCNAMHRFLPMRTLTTRLPPFTDRHHVFALADARLHRHAAPATLVPVLPGVAQPVAVFEPDRRGGDRLADLLFDRQRLRPRHGVAVAGSRLL